MRTALRALLVPHTAWRVPQRFHYFAPWLKESLDLHVTNWDANFSSIADAVSGRYLMNHVPRRWSDAFATVHHVPRLTPAISALGMRRLNESIYQRCLRRIIAEHDINVVVGSYVTAPPTDVAKLLDICDDHAGLWRSRGGDRAYEGTIASNEARWIKTSRYVSVVSTVLADRISKEATGVRVVHIPNGVDLAAYGPDREGARTSLGLDPDAILIGNIGSLSRITEARRVLAVAIRTSKDPRVRVLVVGAGSGVPWLRSEVNKAGLANVEFVGFQTGEALVRYFQAIDIGLCPYPVLPGDDARVPMRLLHYSAVGAHVVCSPLAEVKRMAFQNVTIAPDSDDAFAEEVVRAIDRPRGFVPEQIGQYDARRLASIFAEVLRAAAQE